MVVVYKEKYYSGKRKIIDNSPVELVLHCTYDYPMYILAVRGTCVRASRGYPEEIKLDELSVAKEKIAAFKEWCVENDIEYEEPGWILCSMYG